MSSKTQLKPGSTLQGGKYRILGVLGQGGFGITYEAEQVALGRKVAVKEFFMEEYCNRDGDTSQVSVPSVGSKETVDRFRAKFVKEAKMIAGLNNPHIVKIYDVFEENGTAYYVMEYHDKGSLKDEVAKRGALPEKDAVKRIREVADALRYLHNQNILHLDVKPGNVLRGDNDEMVLIDFGVSKCYDEEGEQTSSTPVAKSKGYAPSELYISGSVSHFSPATDIYSLGATFYHLVTGMVPPDASIVSEEGIDLSTFAVLSKPTRNAIEAAMRPRRKDRPQNIAEFLKILDGNSNAGTDEDKTDFDDHCDDDSTNLDEDIAEPVKVNNTLKKEAAAPVLKPSWIKWVMFAAGLLIALGLFFFLRPKSVPTTGTLAVSSDPSGASVYADISDSLALLGTTPLEVEISKGAHNIVLRKDGYETYITNVTIDEAKTEVNAKLTAKPAATKFYVTTTPSGASVTIGGKSIGKTPIKGIEVTKGNHSVKITKDGYETYTAKLSFGDDPVVVNETLKEKPSQTSSASSQASAAQSTTQAQSHSSASQSATPRPATGTHNGHEWVDLGLSVKWATCNVGASSPSDYGNYYAWGEVRTKSEYWDSNCATYEKSMGDISGNSTYDAARYNWGGKWRLPTKAECQELVGNCTWTWTSQGGHNGYKVTSKKNGASIFLPAAGWRYGSSLDGAGELGYYWSSTPYESGAQNAYILYFSSGNLSVFWYYRYYGHSVRPVSE